MARCLPGTRLEASVSARKATMCRDGHAITLILRLTRGGGRADFLRRLGPAACKVKRQCNQRAELSRGRIRFWGTPKTAQHEGKVHPEHGVSEQSIPATRSLDWSYSALITQAMAAKDDSHSQLCSSNATDSNPTHAGVCAERVPSAGGLAGSGGKRVVESDDNPSRLPCCNDNHDAR